MPGISKVTRAIKLYDIDQDKLYLNDRAGHFTILNFIAMQRCLKLLNLKFSIPR